LSKIVIDERMLSEKISCAKDGDSIELTIVPPQDDDGVHSPAFLHLALIHTGGIYEDIESIDESNITRLHPLQTSSPALPAQSSSRALPSVCRMSAQGQISSPDTSRATDRRKGRCLSRTEAPALCGLSALRVAQHGLRRSSHSYITFAFPAWRQ